MKYVIYSYLSAVCLALEYFFSLVYTCTRAFFEMFSKNKLLLLVIGGIMAFILVNLNLAAAAGMIITLVLLYVCAPLIIIVLIVLLFLNWESVWSDVASWIPYIILSIIGIITLFSSGNIGSYFEGKYKKCMEKILLLGEQYEK